MGEQFMRKILIRLALCAMLSALSFPVEAQQPAKLYRIGFHGFGVATETRVLNRLAAFRRGLREFGWVEGKNIVIEHRWAGGRAERFPALAAELVRLPVDVLLTGSGDPAIQALKEASATIPIVMAVSSDPVGTGLINSLARPGGNITGLSIIATDTGGKRLELLKEAVPKASRVAVFWNSAHPGKQLKFKEAQVAARTLGMTLQSVEVRGPNDFEGAFSAITKGRLHALDVLQEPLISVHRARIADFAAKSRLPTICETWEFAEAGGLMTYGPDIVSMYRRAATHVDKILKGTKPADLPVEQPTKFELVINLKTAKQIGLTIPQSMLYRADKVIK